METMKVIKNGVEEEREVAFTESESLYDFPVSTPVLRNGEECIHTISGKCYVYERVTITGDD